MSTSEHVKKCLGEHVHLYLQTVYVLYEDLKFVSAESVRVGKFATSPRILN